MLTKVIKNPTRVLGTGAEFNRVGNQETYLKTKREAARYLGVSLATLERLIRSGLPHIRISHLVRFRPEDLADFIEQRRVQRSGDAL